LAALGDSKDGSVLIVVVLLINNVVDSTQKYKLLFAQMKTGVEYLHSREKRLLDLSIAWSLQPANYLAQLAAKTFVHKLGDDVLYSDTRIGQNHRRMEVIKIRTLNEYGLEVNQVAASLRAKGLDELPQVLLVRQGNMSIWGARPLLESEDMQLRKAVLTTNTGRNLLAMHDDIVAPARPGMLSSFALYAHCFGDTDPEMRLRLNIHDALHASAAYDMGTLLRGAANLARGELQNGHVGIAAAPSDDTAT
jgi:lipopolysaccharide/colanic/teichoic acid biosynthesis glycosyltransferase